MTKREKMDAMIDKMFENGLSAEMADYLADAVENLVNEAADVAGEQAACRAFGQIEGMLLTLVSYRAIAEDDAFELQKIAQSVLTDCEGEESL